MTAQLIKVTCPNCGNEEAEQFGHSLDCYKCRERYSFDMKSEGWLPAGRLPDDQQQIPGETIPDEEPEKTVYEQLLDEYFGK